MAIETAGDTPSEGKTLFSSLLLAIVLSQAVARQQHCPRKGRRAEAVARHLQACPACLAAAQKSADALLGKVQDARLGPSGTRLPSGPQRPEGPSPTGTTPHPSAQALALYKEHPFRMS
jgi:hypothetical protein